MGERDLAGPLAGLQRLLTNAIRRASPIAGDEELARSVDALVVPSARGMRAAERLEVYREQFWLRHLPSLQDDYPTLAWVLGGDKFHRLAVEYLSACPPRTWNLQLLGAELPRYVASHSPWCSDAIASDAARLDHAFMKAFDAPDAPPFDPRVLASAPEEVWPGANVAFHPSLHAMALAYPLQSLRDALKRGHACERPLPEATRVVVWRDAACFVRTAAVEPVAFELLLALQQGAPLGEACELVAGIHGEADATTLGPRVAAWFQQWTTSGWVSAVRFQP